ncbi:stemmadenine O-acetyltransferase-like [Salvia hispanica]|uniref:stemmadenine O-acetyltransferase-like n=1 Tax=Salvia hispanica TaxID=49212 RepID=UPI002009015B|nr:stemmadenine O-acetyltransferase-like [Salvia hispanica]
MAQTIITTYIVKPSSPTPLAFKIHKLSFLDQMLPPIYTPFIFLYENNESAPQQEISKRLRWSLSETLTIFYPIAGTVIQNSHVNCDDTGAEFVEARVHARLSHFTQNLNFEELVKQLSPTAGSSGTRTLFVKTSFFECGGFAISVSLSHKLADGSSAAAFVRAWAESCRGEASGIIHPFHGQTHLSAHPSFDLALHFPPSASPRPSSLHLGVTREKMATRRLVFDAEKVERMKKLEASRSQVKDPTRVEAVSALLWRSFIAAHKKSGAAETGTTSFHAAHIVNLRPRAGLTDRTFGNCIVVAAASSLGEGEDAVSKLRGAVRGVDRDFINEVVKDEESVRAMDETSDVFRKPRNCVFSSWLRMGLYEVDFGWGKPGRVCVGGFPYINLVVLVEAPPPGDGIEAWIYVADDRFFQLVRSNCEKLLGQDFLA